MVLSLRSSIYYDYSLYKDYLFYFLRISRFWYRDISRRKLAIGPRRFTRLFGKFNDAKIHGTGRMKNSYEISKGLRSW